MRYILLPIVICDSLAAPLICVERNVIEMSLVVQACEEDNLRSGAEDILLCKAEMRYLLTSKVSRYHILPMHGIIGKLI